MAYLYTNYWIFSFTYCLFRSKSWRIWFRLKIYVLAAYCSKCYKCNLHQTWYQIFHYVSSLIGINYSEKKRCIDEHTHVIFSVHALLWHRQNLCLQWYFLYRFREWIIICKARLKCFLELAKSLHKSHCWGFDTLKGTTAKATYVTQTFDILLICLCWTIRHFSFSLMILLQIFIRLIYKLIINTIFFVTFSEFGKKIIWWLIFDLILTFLGDWFKGMLNDIKESKLKWKNEKLEKGKFC